MSIEEAMGSFTPAEGDQLKSQQGSIGNGGNLPNQWRTLTLEEWAYVFNTRSTSTGTRSTGTSTSSNSRSTSTGTRGTR